MTNYLAKFSLRKVPAGSEPFLEEGLDQVPAIVSENMTAWMDRYLQLASDPAYLATILPIRDGVMVALRLT